MSFTNVGVTVTPLTVTCVLLAILVITFQAWAVVSTIVRGRWLWLAAVWFVFPVGAFAWWWVGKPRDNPRRRPAQWDPY